MCVCAGAMGNGRMVLTSGGQLWEGRGVQEGTLAQGLLLSEASNSLYLIMYTYTRGRGNNGETGEREQRQGDEYIHESIGFPGKDGGDEGGWMLWPGLLSWRNAITSMDGTRFSRCSDLYSQGVVAKMGAREGHAAMTHRQEVCSEMLCACVDC